MGWYFGIKCIFKTTPILFNTDLSDRGSIGERWEIKSIIVKKSLKWLKRLYKIFDIKNVVYNVLWTFAFESDSTLIETD